jgi:hypothetical protein
MLYSTSIAQVKKKMHKGKETLEDCWSHREGIRPGIAAPQKIEEEGDTLIICRI